MTVGAHINYLGTLGEASTITFKRMLPGSPARVWEFLTAPDLLVTWFAYTEVDLRVDGQIKIFFDEASDADGACSHGPRGGKVKVCEPARRLVYSFSETADGPTVVSFDIQTIDQMVLLTLAHTGLPQDEMVAFAAGWHSYLDVLQSRLRGEEPQPFAELFQENLQRYAFWLALSGLIASSSPPAVAAPDINPWHLLKQQRNVLLSKYDRLCHDIDDAKANIDFIRKTNAPENDRAVEDLSKTLKDKQRDLRALELDIRDLDKAML